MKKYLKPELEITLFDDVDIIMASGDENLKETGLRDPMSEDEPGEITMDISALKPETSAGMNNQGTANTNGDLSQKDDMDLTNDAPVDNASPLEAVSGTEPSVPEVVTPETTPEPAPEQVIPETVDTTDTIDTDIPDSPIVDTDASVIPEIIPPTIEEDPGAGM